nr:hypothetical protein [Rhizobium setariae]
MHSIFDAVTGERINPASDVEIGAHVWVGNRVLVMKGARIGSGSMIGAGAIVNADVPKNCIAAGQPARVIRESIMWDRRLVSHLPQDAPALSFF